MAETSRPWTDNAIGDGRPYTALEWREIFASFQAPTIATQGVFKGQLNELVIFRTATPNQVTIDTGRALVEGCWYENDALVTFTIPIPVANPRIDRIDLVKGSLPAIQEVRLGRNPGTEAVAPVPPVITQTPGVAWTLPLWELYITPAGTATVWRDHRHFIGQYEPMGLITADGYFEDEFVIPVSGTIGGSEFEADLVNATLSKVYVDGVGELQFNANNAAGRAIIFNGPYDLIHVSPAQAVYRLRFRAAVPNTDAQMNHRCGFYNVNPTSGAPDPNDKIAFETTGVAAWNAVTDAGGAGPATTATGQVQEAAYHIFEIVILSGHGASADVVVFLVDGVVVATHNTFIPAGTLRLCLGEVQTAPGPVADSYLQLDWCRMRGPRT